MGASSLTRFAVVADSHIRFPDDEADVYPSNALMVQRNERVVGMLNEIAPDFVVHLGDIVHPVPADEGHEPAVDLAEQVYAELRSPIHFVPGNHDIGDKPDALVGVPTVEDSFYEVFERRWGPAFKSFDVAGIHFVLIDTPVLGSGLEREETFREWLESDLAGASRAGRRIFVFSHYPPFVLEPGEDEHYDNLAPEPRAWLLGLLRIHKVEAMFSGHVHNFIYNHLDGTDLYVAPSTGFVRPDYSELAAIAPEAEFGRDDPAKLGFFVVDVEPDGHTITPVRSQVGSGAHGVRDPSARSPIGVTLRHDWQREAAFPTAGLDEFRRKTVRDDTTVLALWEARISRVRIPEVDLASPRADERLSALARHGMKVTVRSAGIPTSLSADRIRSAAEAVERWEIVASTNMAGRVLDALDKIGPIANASIAIAPVVPLGGPGHHFVSAGFAPEGGQEVDAWLSGEVVEELTFRIPHDADIDTAVSPAMATADEAGRRAVVTVELPRLTEAALQADDELVADRVWAAVAAAQSLPAVPIFLDGFMDHDRGYYPHHGLLDRRGNPRDAFYSLGLRPGGGS